jgi:hypothetical protein
MKVDDFTELGKMSNTPDIEHDDFFLISVAGVIQGLKLKGVNTVQQGSAKATSLVLSELQ